MKKEFISSPKYFEENKMGKMTLDPAAQAYADLAELDSVAATKLAGIDANAKDDQTGAEIKAAYEGEAGAFTDTKDTKLTGIADGAEVNPADLAALDPTANTKLGGIEENAKDDQSGDEIVAAIDAGTVPITREGALSQADLKLVKSEPAVGEHKINFVVRKADGKLEADYEDVPES